MATVAKQPQQQQKQKNEVAVKKPATAPIVVQDTLPAYIKQEGAARGSEMEREDRTKSLKPQAAQRTAAKGAKKSEEFCRFASRTLRLFFAIFAVKSYLSLCLACGPAILSFRG